MHETVFRMTLIQKWTTRWSKDRLFWPRDKTWMFYIFTFYFPQKCAMRSSSIESNNNTTTYNRPILCSSREQLGEAFIFSLLWNGFADIEQLATQRTREMHFAHWRGEKEKTNKQTGAGDKTTTSSIQEINERTTEQKSVCNTLEYWFCHIGLCGKWPVALSVTQATGFRTSG